MMDYRVLEAVTKTYFGCVVNAYREDTKSPYPWLFSVYYDGVWHDYRGIPNYCATKAQALKRAWFRAKWFSDGSYKERYHAMEPND